MCSDLISCSSIYLFLYLRTRKQSIIIMKLSSTLVVSMTTAASMAAAVDIRSDTASAASAVGDTSSLLTGIHHHPNASTHVQESLPRSDDTTAAIAPSALLHNKEHTSGGGSKNVDVGLLPISERLLDSSVQEDCAATCNNWDRPVINEKDGTSFRDLLEECTYRKVDCPSYLDYGNIPIGCWDTWDVTDMAYALSLTRYAPDVARKKDSLFNQSINCWNTARVTSMLFMFDRAPFFNQPLHDWDVASVTTMKAMFANARLFNQPLDDWNVSSVNNMRSLLFEQFAFNQPLNNWNVSSVTTLRIVFHGNLLLFKDCSAGQKCNRFNQPLNDWNVSRSVNTMRSMFLGHTGFNQPLNDWDVSNVSEMRLMFNDAFEFNQCLSSWASKTPTDVDLFNMLYRTSCPNTEPVESVGPWCQGEDEQCLAPSDAITDPPTSAPSASPTSAPSASPTSVPSALLTSTTSTPPTVGPVALPTEVPTAGSIARPTAGPIAKQKKTSKKSKK